MNISRFALCFGLVAVLVGFAACDGAAPLSEQFQTKGWSRMKDAEGKELFGIIKLDYQAYVDSLPEAEKKNAALPENEPGFLQDDSGQHAIIFQIAVENTVWEYVLIYDKSNKRVKTMRYKHFQSAGC